MDTTIDFKWVEPYLIGFQIDQIDEDELDFPNEERIELMRSFGLEGPTLTAGVRFLSEQSFAWEVRRILYSLLNDDMMMSLMMMSLMMMI